MRGRTQWEMELLLDPGILWEDASYAHAFGYCGTEYEAVLGHWYALLPHQEEVHVIEITYNYDIQAWTKDGVVQKCGHSSHLSSCTSCKWHGFRAADITRRV